MLILGGILVEGKLEGGGGPEAGDTLLEDERSKLEGGGPEAGDILLEDERGWFSIRKSHTECLHQRHNRFSPRVWQVIEKGE